MCITSADPVVTSSTEMLTRKDALDGLAIIVAKVPTLATQAAKCQRRSNDRLLIKQASNLSMDALKSRALTAPERAVLARLTEGIADDTRGKMLRVRLSNFEQSALEAAAEAEGFRDLSGFVRWKCLGIRD